MLQPELDIEFCLIDRVSVCINHMQFWIHVSHGSVCSTDIHTSNDHMLI